MTDFLQVEGDIALASQADLETNFVALRFVLRKVWERSNLFLATQSRGSLNADQGVNQQSLPNHPLNDRAGQSPCAYSR